MIFKIFDIYCIYIYNKFGELRVYQGFFEIDDISVRIYVKVFRLIIVQGFFVNFIDNIICNFVLLKRKLILMLKMKNIELY